MIDPSDLRSLSIGLERLFVSSTSTSSWRRGSQWREGTDINFLYCDIAQPSGFDHFVQLLHDSPDNELESAMSINRAEIRTSSTNAVLYNPKNTLPKMALSHLVGIGSCSASIVFTRSCISSYENTSSIDGGRAEAWTRARYQSSSLP